MAIQLLREAQQPLGYIEITRLALERNLIETSGKTPEATMASQINRDIKSHKSDSPFVRVSPGIFRLNPNYKEVKVEEDELEREPDESTETERAINLYIGKAGEHLVVSELLFQGYNASILSVDEGLDIVATRKGKLFNIQAKTSNENRFNRHVSDITVSSFEKHRASNTFYVFVLKGKKDTKFLVFPYNEIQKFIDQRAILPVNKKTRYRVNISVREGKMYLGNQQNEVSYYLGKWNLIQ